VIDALVSSDFRSFSSWTLVFDSVSVENSLEANLPPGLKNEKMKCVKSWLD